VLPAALRLNPVAAKALRTSWRKSLHLALRAAFGALPRSLRFALFRRLIHCDPAPDPRLVVKIADTQAELEASFALLHDAYVASGYMQPHASGLRVTPYHALPTTTTICAKWDGRVVGTISMVREGVFGFPLQSVFDLSAVRAKGGQVAEVSALAVAPDFRGGDILFPLLKFMYEYSTRYFDVRHLVIAVHPTRIEMYEALLFFERLQASEVDRYDFANGAPAVGATLDLAQAPAHFARAYRGKPRARDLLAYFTTTPLPHLQLPERRYHVTNDPVLTPALLEHFFVQRVPVLASLPERRRELLHSIYDTPDFRAVLDDAAGPGSAPVPSTQHPMRRHQRYSIRLPARLSLGEPRPTGEVAAAHTADAAEAITLSVIEVSLHGFQAECDQMLPLDRPTEAHVELGHHDHCTLRAVPVRRHALGASLFYGFRVDHPDAAWRTCVLALERGLTHADLKVA
jgi:GNAT superfamily N-acetyltransferase